MNRNEVLIDILLAALKAMVKEFSPIHLDEEISSHRIIIAAKAAIAQATNEFPPR